MKTHTFRIACTLFVQFSVDDAAVEADPEGGEADIRPNESALTELQTELQEHFGEHHSITGLEFDTDGCELVGTVEE